MERRVRRLLQWKCQCNQMIAVRTCEANLKRVNEYRFTFGAGNGRASAAENLVPGARRRRGISNQEHGDGGERQTRSG